MRNPFENRPVVSRFRPSSTIAVDVDGTLVKGGELDKEVVAFCRKHRARGYFLILWSARGEAHARTEARRFNVARAFDLIISKPGFIVDDRGWSWTRHTRLVEEMDCDLPDVATRKPTRRRNRLR